MRLAGCWQENEQHCRPEAGRHACIQKPSLSEAKALHGHVERGCGFERSPCELQDPNAAFDTLRITLNCSDSQQTCLLLRQATTRSLVIMRARCRAFDEKQVVVVATGCSKPFCLAVGVSQ